MIWTFGYFYLSQNGNTAIPRYCNGSQYVRASFKIIMVMRYSNNTLAILWCDFTSKTCRSKTCCQHRLRGQWFTYGLHEFIRPSRRRVIDSEQFAWWPDYNTITMYILVVRVHQIRNQNWYFWIYCQLDQYWSSAWRPTWHARAGFRIFSPRMQPTLRVPRE